MAQNWFGAGGEWKEDIKTRKAQPEKRKEFYGDKTLKKVGKHLLGDISTLSADDIAKKLKDHAEITKDDKILAGKLASKKVTGGMLMSSILEDFFKEKCASKQPQADALIALKYLNADMDNVDYLNEGETVEIENGILTVKMGGEVVARGSLIERGKLPAGSPEAVTRKITVKKRTRQALAGLAAAAGAPSGGIPSAPGSAVSVAPSGSPSLSPPAPPAPSAIPAAASPPTGLPSMPVAPIGLPSGSPPVPAVLPAAPPPIAPAAVPPILVPAPSSPPPPPSTAPPAAAPAPVSPPITPAAAPAASPSPPPIAPASAPAAPSPPAAPPPAAPAPAASPPAPPEISPEEKTAIENIKRQILALKRYAFIKQRPSADMNFDVEFTYEGVVIASLKISAKKDQRPELSITAQDGAEYKFDDLERLFKLEDLIRFLFIKDITETALKNTQQSYTPTYGTDPGGLAAEYKIYKDSKRILNIKIHSGASDIRLWSALVENPINQFQIPHQKTEFEEWLKNIDREITAWSERIEEQNLGTLRRRISKAEIVKDASFQNNDVNLFRVTLRKNGKTACFISFYKRDPNQAIIYRPDGMPEKEMPFNTVLPEINSKIENADLPEPPLPPEEPAAAPVAPAPHFPAAPPAPAPAAPPVAAPQEDDAEKLRRKEELHKTVMARFKTEFPDIVVKYDRYDIFGYVLFAKEKVPDGSFPAENQAIAIVNTGDELGKFNLLNNERGRTAKDGGLTLDQVIEKIKSKIKERQKETPAVQARKKEILAYPFKNITVSASAYPQFIFQLNYKNNPLAAPIMYLAIDPDTGAIMPIYLDARKGISSFGKGVYNTPAELEADINEKVIFARTIRTLKEIFTPTNYQIKAKAGGASQGAFEITRNKNGQRVAELKVDPDGTTIRLTIYKPSITERSLEEISVTLENWTDERDLEKKLLEAVDFEELVRKRKEEIINNFNGVSEFNNLQLEDAGLRNHFVYLKLTAKDDNKALGYIGIFNKNPDYITIETADHERKAETKNIAEAFQAVKDFLPIAQAKERKVQLVERFDAKFTRQKFQEILTDANKITDMGQRVTYIGSRLLGIRYRGDTLLNESDHPRLLIDFTGVDCVTFTETVMAMALANPPTYVQFGMKLKALRYKNGKVGMEERNHYFAADWIPNNAAFVADVTAEIGGADIKRETKTLDVVHDIVRKPRATITYIPKASAEKYKDKLKDGDIVVFTSGQRNLDVKHVSFVIIDHGEPYLLHAKEGEKVRIDSKPLFDYLRDSRQFTGIKILRPVQ